LDREATISRNGSGVYSLPAGSTVANGDISDASDINGPLADLEADANVARPIVAGGTGATTASAARTALGLAIGTDVQAYDAGLASIAGLTTAADKMIYTTAADTYAVASLTAAARGLLDDATVADMRTTLDVPEAGNITTTDIAAATLVTAADTVRSNDNDTTFPTTAAVKAHADGTLATAQVTTSGTAFDFTGLPAGVRRLVVMFGGCSLSGTDDLLVQLGDSGGLATSGYAASCFDHAGMVNSGSGFIVYAGAAANTVHGSITLTLLNSSTNRWVAQIGAFRSTTSAIGGGGGVVLSGALDRVRLTRTGTNTFDAGSVSIWYR